MANLRLPNINAQDPMGQIRQIVSYLRYLVQELNFSAGSQEKPKEETKAQTAQTGTSVQSLPVGAVLFTVDNRNPQGKLGGRWEAVGEGQLPEGVYAWARTR